MPEPLEYKFNHLHVYCSDVDASARWFVDALGAELVSDRDSLGIPARALQLGGARVLLRGAREGENLAPAGPQHYGTDHFGLEVSDVDATVDELKRRGVFIDVEPWNIRPETRIAFVKGPDNVRIELVQNRS